MPLSPSDADLRQLALFELTPRLFEFDSLSATEASTETRADAEDDAPLLVPVLSLRKELTLRLLVLLTVAAMAWFWMWWIGEGHGTWTAPSVIVTTLFAWASVLSMYFLFFITRMTKPNPALPVPRACASPWS